VVGCRERMLVCNARVSKQASDVPAYLTWIHARNWVFRPPAHISLTCLSYCELLIQTLTKTSVSAFRCFHTKSLCSAQYPTPPHNFARLFPHQITIQVVTRLHSASFACHRNRLSVHHVAVEHYQTHIDRKTDLHQPLDLFRISQLP
jgi:hypothetical protein